MKDVTSFMHIEVLLDHVFMPVDQTKGFEVNSFLSLFPHFSWSAVGIFPLIESGEGSAVGRRRGLLWWQTHWTESESLGERESCQSLQTSLFGWERC